MRLVRIYGLFEDSFMDQVEARKLLLEYAGRPIGSNQAGVRIDYTNYKGERSVRRIIPAPYSLREVNESDPALLWHKKGEWVFDAFDLDKMADWTFSIWGVDSWEVLVQPPIPPPPQRG